jgi:peptidoglycan hydrolase-like protein with peptidoglycan-binding domain
MNWTALLPALVQLLSSLSAGLFTPVPPGPPITPTTPLPSGPPPGVVPVPDAAIKALQALLNTLLALNPPLAIDGWLGPKTDAAIMDGIAKLKAAGVVTFTGGGGGGHGANKPSAKR